MLRALHTYLVMGCFAAMCVIASAYAALADETPPELVNMVVGLLHESDKDMRSVGLDQVRGELKGAKATLRFADELPKLSPEGQAGLLSALADRGDAAARPAVLKLLAMSAHASVKTAAVRALGSLGETADVPALVKLLTAEAALAEASRASLVRLHSDGVSQAIVEQIDAAPPPVRVTLIAVLSERRAFDVIPNLLARAVDNAAATRMAAMTALAQLASSEHVAGMLAAVLKAETGRERDAAERAVATVCARINDPTQRAEPLLAALATVNEPDRVLLLPLLGRVGGTKALAVIEQAIASSDAKTQELGLRGLCNWPDATTARRLIELIKVNSFAPHRLMLIAALTRVAPLPDGRSDAERLALLQQAMSLCETDAQRNEALRRAQVIRSLETLRYLLPFVDQPAFAEQACESIVELAHHRNLREPNKAVFDPVLDKVMATSRNATTVDRAKRYKAGQTWVRPKSG